MIKKTVAKTRLELAKALGRSERMVASYLAEGMPGIPGHYVVEDCAAWLQAREDRRKAPIDEDIGDGDGDSPALERYRLARAKQEELKLAKLQRELIEADAVTDWLQRFSVLMRGFGEKVNKVCPELSADLEGVLDQASEMLDGVASGQRDAS